eukprot:scaffold609_cov234-Pinguiococcus_pyrenoidosus.AAC.9
MRLNIAVASSRRSRFLSGCHSRAFWRYCLVISSCEALGSSCHSVQTTLLALPLCHTSLLPPSYLQDLVVVVFIATASGHDSAFAGAAWATRTRDNAHSGLRLSRAEKAIRRRARKRILSSCFHHPRHFLDLPLSFFHASWFASSRVREFASSRVREFVIVRYRGGENGARRSVCPLKTVIQGSG